jgi:hypothetical protein
VMAAAELRLMRFNRSIHGDNVSWPASRKHVAEEPPLFIGEVVGYATTTPMRSFHSKRCGMAAVRPSHRRGNNCFIEASKAKRNASARLLVVVDWVAAPLGDTPEKPATEGPEQSGLSREFVADSARELRDRARAKRIHYDGYAARLRQLNLVRLTRRRQMI